MKHHKFLFLLLFLWVNQTALFSTNPEPAKLVANAQSAQAQFWENKGQVWKLGTETTAHEVKFSFEHKGLKIFLLEAGLAYQFEKIHYPEGYKHLDKFDKEGDGSAPLTNQDREANDKLRSQIRSSAPLTSRLETHRMDMQLIGANPHPRISKSGESTDFINFYNRNTLNVHGYEKITYHEIYPNIDWVIYTDKNGGVKYDFVAHANADISRIKIRFQDHEKAQINPDGSFTLSNPMGSITEQAPVSFQNEQAVATRFVYKDNILSFAVANYNPNQDLRIDPSLLWATYYGGTGDDKSFSCKVDASGNVYLAGTTQSNNAIAANGHQNTIGSSHDIFLAKFNANGTRIWATYYGGTELEFGASCAVDANGNVYLAGNTQSTTTIASGGHQNIQGGNTDAFLVKFNSSGTRLWATYYGGANFENGDVGAIDANGNVYLAGSTGSTTSIASGGHQNTAGGNGDAFLVKFNSAGTRLWATYYGGTDTDNGGTYNNSCAVDASGNVYMMGFTRSSNAIASNGHQNTIGDVVYGDAFLVKFNSAGTRLWATYYGGTEGEYAHFCVVDASGNVYLAGSSSSTSGIASGGHQNTYAGNSDAFLVKFNSAGIRLWGTYYGGNNLEFGHSCAVDANENVYLCGYTSSNNNIASGGYQNTRYNNNGDAFLVKFNSAGTRLWGTYYGGTGDNRGSFCTTDAYGNVYLGGETSSTDYIASNAHQSTLGGAYDAFLAKFRSEPCTTITGSFPQTICAGQTFLFNGINRNTSGAYLDTLVASNGCDSVLTLNLSVTNIDTIINQQGNTLSARQTGATYQWVECPSTPILGANAASFTPTVSGNYAVSVTFNGCSALSGCRSITITPTSVESIDNQININIYPNPNTGEFFVQHKLDFAYIRVSDLLGRTIHSQISQQENTTIITIPQAAQGIYIVSILDKNHQIVVQSKILVQP